MKKNMGISYGLWDRHLLLMQMQEELCSCWSKTVMCMESWPEMHLPHMIWKGHFFTGQDIYTQRSQPNGHYNHLDVCNKVRRSGSIPQFIKDYDLDDGIICSCVKNDIPIVLAGSIRDDGPLPEVIGDVYEAANTMRGVVRKATTVICMATMLHTIATGNMTPSFRVLEDGTVRPLYLYTVDADEFVVNKLLDRGSLSATTIVTNVQDFITLVAKGLDLM